MILNEEKVPSPREFYYMAEERENPRGEVPCWNDVTVKLKKRLNNSPDNMLVFKDTYEAIVDRKTFDLVQKHFAGRKHPDNQSEMDEYAEYLFCSECGQKYTFTKPEDLIQ